MLYVTWCNLNRSVIRGAMIDSLSSVRPFVRLHRLVLAGTNVDDAGLADIVALRQLESLDLE